MRACVRVRVCVCVCVAGALYLTLTLSPPLQTDSALRWAAMTAIHEYFYNYDGDKVTSVHKSQLLKRKENPNQTENLTDVVRLSAYTINRPYPPGQNRLTNANTETQTMFYIGEKVGMYNYNTNYTNSIPSEL